MPLTWVLRESEEVVRDGDAQDSAIKIGTVTSLQFQCYCCFSYLGLRYSESCRHPSILASIYFKRFEISPYRLV